MESQTRCCSRNTKVVSACIVLVRFHDRVPTCVPAIGGIIRGCRRVDVSRAVYASIKMG